MKKIYKIALAVIFSMATWASTDLSAQVYFSENFNGGVPAGWATQDVDGNTVNANVAAVVPSGAWDINEDPDSVGSGDSIMVSTSWYTPAGQSDDWLISPAVTIPGSSMNLELSWQGQAPDPAYPDGYEVYVDTVANVHTSTSRVLLTTVPGENDTWTDRFVVIPASLAGFNLYFAWRNTSNDQFLLYVDNVKVEEKAAGEDIALNSALQTSEYTQIPVKHIPSSLNLGAIVENKGTDSLKGAMVTLTVFQDGSALTPATQTVADLAVGEQDTVTFTYAPSAAGVYEFLYVGSTAGNDTDPTNDTTIGFPILITQNTYARDDGIVTGSLGIGPGTPGELGQSFQLLANDTMNSVDIVLTNGNNGNTMTGQPVSAKIYSTDPSTGEPMTSLGQTSVVVVQDTGLTQVNLPIAGGLALTPGLYAVIVQEGDSNLTLATTTNIFTPGVTWVDFPGSPAGGWANSELFGFLVTYVVRPNFGAGAGCALAISSVTVQDVLCNGDATGSAAVTVSGASGAETYSWSSGGTSSTETGLAAGTYTVTIDDGPGCSVDSTISITEPAALVATATGYPASSPSATDGSASASATGGTPNYVYTWSPGGATGDSISGLAPGTYTVTVTDAAGCRDTASALVSGTVGISGDLTGAELSIYPNPVGDQVQLVADIAISTELTVRIVDNTGREVYRETSASSNYFETNIDASQWSAGTYMVIWTTENGRATSKLIKQ